MTILSTVSLEAVCGGASQAELRELAKSYCPKTYEANKAKPITRPLAERCLDEAGYGSFKSMLDKYFPK